MYLTNLYKGIKVNQQSIMWIALLFIAIITLPLLIQKLYRHEGMSGRNDADADADADAADDSTGEEDELNALSVQMDERAGKIEAQQQATDIQESINRNQKKKTIIGSVKTETSNVEGQISSLNPKLVNIKSKFSELEPLITKQTELETTITTSETQSDIDAAEVAKIENNSTITSKVQSVKGDINTLKGDINAILSKIDNMDTQLLELEL